MLTFSLTTPLILPIATVAFGSAWVTYQYILQHLAHSPVETRGRLYFPAFFHLFVGLYAQQLTLIGLFILKFDPRNKFHDLGQLTILVATLLLCMQYHSHLRRRFKVSIQHDEGFEDLPRCSTDPQLPRQDTPCVTSTANHDVSDEMDELLGDSQAVIWLPKDALGISACLRDQVRARFFADSATVVQMVDSDTQITEDGQVSVETEGVSLVDLPRSTPTC